MSRERRNCGSRCSQRVVWSGSGRYLRSVDKYNEWLVSAFVAPNSKSTSYLNSLGECLTDYVYFGSTVKLVLLHDIRNEEGIRWFFMDVWESYVKVGSPRPDVACQ